MVETARTALLALVEADPTLTQRQLAERLGVSPQRISQLVKAERLAVPKGPLGVGRKAAAPPPQSRVITGGIPVPISHTVAGTIGELLVAADLMARGYAVFFPLTRTALCDLVAMTREARTRTIEVRCGHRSGERLVFSKKASLRADHYAVVITGEPVVYEPPL